ncbi:peptidase M61 [Sphingomonas oleivorans]|uniref:Peptidase M61 n=1 Tax=Sphingomonas oleivorans TaxID=1735121 RepID=A0A2T5G2X3_9SPHN|nr:M61 family metallopeptidase [Sphingomonas oleivorans]PTQ13493.1 peptidase M61 [Sphingomonas oleivorans]
MRAKPLFLALLLAASPAAFAQTVANSAPQPVAIVDSIPPARDIDYPGVIKIAVDASDVARGIFRTTQTIPVSGPGPLTLLYPKWLPGNHSPSGAIDKLAGLVVKANGQPLRWMRDPVDVYAFTIDVPQGVTSLEVSFQFLSPTSGNQGRTVMTPDMLNLQWNAVTLYPAGYFVRRIPVEASVIYPKGWKSATALETDGPAGDTVRYKQVSYETLVDSPIFAGRYNRVEQLAPGVRLNIFADKPEQLAATPEQLALHRNLATQAIKLFGAQHYDHYDFLFALSDNQGGIGLEHQRSSENGVDPEYFTDWDASVVDRDLLPHEYTHSWNGKYRRGADLWTPDYRMPMRDSLLWVYEGQTQFWGNVLAARSGLVPKEDALASLAMDAALYDTRPGRQWRPLIDTTNDPTISQRRPKPWTSWQRSEDYYVEGQLVWLDVDSLIRERSGGKRSLDDFARAFFGVNDRDWGQLTYTFDDVVATLNKVEPYDWASFLKARLYDVRDRAPLDWLARGGYRLTYVEEPTNYWERSEASRDVVDLSYSLGLVVNSEAMATGVVWDGPAFNAGITVGSTLVAVDGRSYSDDTLKSAIKAAKTSKQPIHLLVEQDDLYRDIAINWTEGLRYPKLERIGKGPSTLDALLAPKK